MYFYPFSANSDCSLALYDQVYPKIRTSYYFDTLRVRIKHIWISLGNLLNTTLHTTIYITILYNIKYLILWSLAYMLSSRKRRDFSRKKTKGSVNGKYVRSRTTTRLYFGGYIRVGDVCYVTILNNLLYVPKRLFWLFLLCYISQQNKLPSISMYYEVRNPFCSVVGSKKLKISKT